jgi:uncharacterized protein YodC (DUF2158 family)
MNRNATVKQGSREKTLKTGDVVSLIHGGNLMTVICGDWPEEQKVEVAFWEQEAFKTMWIDPRALEKSTNHIPF